MKNRILLLCAVCLATLNLSAALMVDFNRNTPTNTQSGYEAFSFADPGGATVSDTYTNSLGTGGGGSDELTVSVLGATHFRNSSGSITGTFAGSSDLLYDQILDNTQATSDAMILRFTDLAAGTYNLTTYHHSGSESAAGGEISISIKATDAIGTNRSIFSSLAQSYGTAPTSITAPTYTIQSDGINPVDVSFAYVSESPSGGNNWITLNGFELAVVPEPSSLVLVGLGLLGLCAARRRR